MTHRACLAVAMLACAPGLFGQQKVVIQGTAIEAGTGLPIPGAKAVLHYNTSPVPLDTAIADASGSFRLSAAEPYRYDVEVTAPGFRDSFYSGTEGRGIDINQAAFDKAADDKPFATITVELPRQSSITGRIRDADTSKPLGTLTVRVLRLGSMGGIKRLFEETIVFTGDDGTFRVEPLGSGEYILEIQNRNPLTKEEEASPKRYPRIYWPSGDPETQDAIKLRQGAEFNIGTLQYSKVVLPKVQAAIDWKCTPDAVFQITIAQRIAKGLLDRPRESGVCGRPFAIQDLSPGSYKVDVTAFGKSNAFGTTEVRVEEGRDLEFELKPIVIEPVSISGKITCECDKPFVPGESHVQFDLYQPGSSFVAAFQVEADGTFEKEFLIQGNALFNARNIPAGFYLKRLLINGTQAKDPFGAMPVVSGTMEIVLSDKAATIAGTILKEGKPRAGVLAIVARWPLAEATDGRLNALDLRTAPVDADGSFHISALSPGTYRVACFSMAGLPPRQLGFDPAWLDTGQSVTLAEKESRSVILDSKEPCATSRQQ
jgi:hypothetical protein